MYQRIKKLREDNDLTQKQMGEILNCSQRAYSYYESGQHNTPNEVLLKLADFYGVSTDYLLGRTDQPN